jgi:23S rRNA (guanosine2251-2'-O)-methyltransferase
MKPIQLTHLQVSNKKTDKDIVVVSNQIRTPENVGMLFRVAEAFGVKSVILAGDSPNLTNKKVLRTARQTEKKLNITCVESIDNVIPELKKNEFHLIGLELTNTSSLLKTYDFNSHKKIAIFIGSERFGIDTSTLEQLDVHLHFNLFGKNSSINVVNALAISLYEITRN